MTTQQREQQQREERLLRLAADSLELSLAFLDAQRSRTQEVLDLLRQHIQSTNLPKLLNQLPTLQSHCCLICGKPTGSESDICKGCVYSGEPPLRSRERESEPAPKADGRRKGTYQKTLEHWAKIEADMQANGPSTIKQIATRTGLD